MYFNIFNGANFYLIKRLLNNSLPSREGKEICPFSASSRSALESIQRTFLFILLLFILLSSLFPSSLLSLFPSFYSPLFSSFYFKYLFIYLITETLLRANWVTSDSFAQYCHVIHVWRPGLMRHLYGHQSFPFVKVSRFPSIKYYSDPESSYREWTFACGCREVHLFSAWLHKALLKHKFQSLNELPSLTQDFRHNSEEFVMAQ
jgi:hypothetical protein